MVTCELVTSYLRRVKTPARNYSPHQCGNRIFNVLRMGECIGWADFEIHFWRSYRWFWIANMIISCRWRFLMSSHHSLTIFINEMAEAAIAIGKYSKPVQVQPYFNTFLDWICLILPWHFTPGIHLNPAKFGQLGESTILKVTWFCVYSCIIQRYNTQNNLKLTYSFLLRRALTILILRQQPSIGEGSTEVHLVVVLAISRSGRQVMYLLRHSRVGGSPL